MNDILVKFIINIVAIISFILAGFLGLLIGKYIAKKQRLTQYKGSEKE